MYTNSNMASKGLSHYDAAERERSSLEYVLEREKREKDDTKYLSVKDALLAGAVSDSRSVRNITRVLFISQDESLLNPTQQSLDGYTNISELFDEVHILILRQGIPAKNPVLRVAKNVWLYTASYKDWWGTPIIGKRLIEEQLVFAYGIRPDIIVARDPFESAVLANYIGKKHGRPVQVHIVEDYSKNEFLEKSKQNKWRRRLIKLTLRGVVSIRTSTRAIYDKVLKDFAPKDLGILPRFNNYESLIKIEPTLDLKAKYKPFVFIILYIGKLNHDSMLYKAIDAARFGLKNPHIGLVVLGDGSAKKEFEDRAKILGVREQIVFESDIRDDVPYLKSANVLIVPDTSPESEEVALRGAAAGIPMILTRTPTREDIFSDGESALMCDADSVDEFSLKLNILMNDIVLRKQMVDSAQEMIESKFHEDPNKYLAAYRESIEQVLFLNSDKEVKEDAESDKI